MDPARDDHELLVLDVEDGVGAGDCQDWHVVARQRLEKKIVFGAFFSFSSSKNFTFSC